ncbi:uncharacterized protein [Lolium perenne]|uniref:uncharacterized protein n=1 Tax=Lolium perenne TaxID=4522 RepID=UPI0021F5980E|nr:uncharacterized protein LOC127297676 [Lolium perenne]
MDSKRKDHGQWANMGFMLQRDWKRFIKTAGGEWKPELTFEDYPCLKQEPENNLCGYHVCEFIREMAYHRDPEAAIHSIRMERLRDSLLTEDHIRSIQEELAGFIVREVIAPIRTYHREFVYDIRHIKYIW